MNPFPGMDPYLEAPHIWPDFHDSLASTLRAVLNEALPAPYYARLQMRPEMGVILEMGTLRRIVPDITVLRYPEPSANPTRRIGEVAVVEKPRIEVSKGIEARIHTDPLQHHSVEIRDTSQGHKLITLIEIVSPANKHPGPDRRAYEAKQGEVLESDANLIELDLLRAGRRLLPYLDLEAVVHELVCDYLILINRAVRRQDTWMDYTVYPVKMRDTLPCIPVPLAGSDLDIPLDIQAAANRAHREGPYLRSVDYQKDIEPPASEDDLAWVAIRLEQAGLRKVVN